VARTNEGATFEFQRIIAQPQGIDLAVLKFSAEGVSFLKLGKSTDAVEGQQVIVIGSPEGLQGTVSEGIISAFAAGSCRVVLTVECNSGIWLITVCDLFAICIGPGAAQQEQAAQL
jgi:hypothetical protein